MFFIIPGISHNQICLVNLPAVDPAANPETKIALSMASIQKQVSIEDSAQLETMPSDLTEQELASLACVRLKTCLDRQLSAPPEHWLTYERAIAYYLRLIISSINKNATLKEHGVDDGVLTVMDFIHEANEKQNVQ